MYGLAVSIGIGVSYIVHSRSCGVRFYRDMPIDTPGLLSSFHSFHLLLSCWAGVALYSIATFTHRTARGKALLALPPTVFCLIQFGTITTYLGNVILSADITVIVATKALFYPVGTII